MTAAAPIAEPAAAIGRVEPAPFWRRAKAGRALPVLTVLLAILALWYAGAVFMNWTTAGERFLREVPDATILQRIAATLFDQRPLLPAPHQIAIEVWNTTVGVRPTSPRSLLFHAQVTLSSTLLGFLLGTLLGMALSLGILASRTLEKSLMPWIIASQTIPILAIAPMIVVVLASIGVSGLLPKAMISTYLSFFPVVVGMTKGLRSPDAMHLDLMRTYGASGGRCWPSCACRPRFRFSSPPRKWRSPPPSSARSSASCRPARRPGSARGFSPAPITGRRSRSGRRWSRPPFWPVS